MSRKNKIIIFLLIALQTAVITYAFAQENDSDSPSGKASSYEENLKRWQSMSEEQREAIRQKVHALDAQQKEAVLENAKQFKQLPKEEQSDMKSNFQKFK